MERFDNWMSYSFDVGPEYGPKTGPASVFNLHFKRGVTVKPMTYLESLLYNARMIAENFPGPFDVLLSGGLDSEIVVRSFKEIGVTQRVHTIKLKNDYNIQDVLSAQRICNKIGVDLNIIEFDLESWFEHEAEAMYKRTYVPLVELLPRFAWFDYFDGTLVWGDGEPYWRRMAGGNYNVKSHWAVVWDEDDWSNSVYAKQIGRTVIAEWYQYTPEITMTFHHEHHIKKLLNDEIYGKQSTWSSRTEVHRPLWPDIEHKPKLVGYEGYGYANTRPQFMADFQTQVMAGVANRQFFYTYDQFENLLK